MSSQPTLRESDTHALPAHASDGYRPPRIRRRLLTFALLVVLAIALVLSVPGLHSVIHQLRRITPMSIAGAVALELASCFSFVILFRRFFDRLPARAGRTLAWTEMGTGALLPGGGVGGLAIGGWLICMAGAPKEWVVRRSGSIFLLTTAVNSVAIIGSGLALLLGAPGPHSLLKVGLPTAIAAIATVAVAALPRLTRSRPGTPHWIASISQQVAEAEDATFSHPSWRLIGALGYLGFDMAVLWLTLRTLGASMSVPALILAYNIGYLGNALPIPGGIGLLDAGLTGAIVLYGGSAVHAAAAVIVYHAVALWIPGVGGTIAYLILRPRLIAAGRARPSSPTPNPDVRP